MAVTGVGLQASLYITFLLIFSPVISLLLFVALSLFHSRSHFLSVLSGFHLERLSLALLLFSDCCGLRRCCCAGSCHHSAEKRNNSQLFYSFSSSCHNIPPMLKGLDYFGVTSSAISFLSFHKTLSGGGGAVNLCFQSTLVLCSVQMLFENV